MLIVVIFTLLCVVSFGLGTGMAVATYGSCRKKFISWLSIGLVSLALTIAGNLTIYHSVSDEIGTAVAVAYVDSSEYDGRTTVYYDEESDEYFIVTINWLTIGDWTTRTSIDANILSDIEN